MLRVRYGNVNRVLTEEKWNSNKVVEEARRPAENFLGRRLDSDKNVEKVEDVEKRGKNYLLLCGPSLTVSLGPLPAST
jgi:hypothetical protein